MLASRKVNKILSSLSIGFVYGRMASAFPSIYSGACHTHTHTGFEKVTFSTKKYLEKITSVPTRKAFTAETDFLPFLLRIFRIDMAEIEFFHEEIVTPCDKFYLLLHEKIWFFTDKTVFCCCKN